MGRKQTGARKQIHFYTAVLLISLIITGCYSSPLNKKEGWQNKDDPQAHLASGKRLFGEGDFAGAVGELEKASSPALKNSVTEEALLYLGSIYADPTNPKRDHGKAIIHFKKLSDGYPKSVLTEQARIMLTIMKENDDSTRTIERLKAVIEASKKVDIEIEDKRREKMGK